MKGRGEEQRAYRLSSSPSGSASVPGSRSRLRPEEYHGLRSFALGASATPRSVSRSVSPGARGGPRFVERTGTSIVAIPCCRRIGNGQAQRHRWGCEEGRRRTCSKSSKKLICPVLDVSVEGPGASAACASVSASSALSLALAICASTSSRESLSFRVLGPCSPARWRKRSIRASESYTAAMHQRPTGDVSGMRIYDVRDVRRASSCPPRRPPAASPPPRPA